MEQRIKVIISIAALVLIMILLIALIMTDRPAGPPEFTESKDRTFSNRYMQGADIYDMHDPFGPWRQAR